MTLSNLRWTSGATAIATEGADATSIEDAGKDELNATGEGTVNGVDEEAKTVVIGGMAAGADDVAITGVDGEELNGITDDPGAGTIRCVLACLTPGWQPVSIPGLMPV